MGYDPADIKPVKIIVSSVSITFEGKVSDADDGSPIMGAVVILDTRTAYPSEQIYSDPVETDKDGRYSLYYEGLLGHGWTGLIVNADGYYTTSKGIIDFTSTLQSIDFELYKK